MQRSIRSVFVGLALAPSLVLAAHAATPVSSVSASSDVSVQLGVNAQDTNDEDVAVDDLGGVTTLAPLAARPAASDVTGYDLLASEAPLLCFDTAVDLTTIELPGLFAEPGDVVRFVGPNWVIDFDASANGVPDGARCDAVTLDASENLLLSFDVAVALPGGVFAADEDLVRIDGPSTFTLFFDGSAEGIPEAADMNGAHRLLNGNLAISLDVSTTVGGVGVDDEDVIEWDSGDGTWSLAYDGSEQDPDWQAADLDAVALPEPSLVLLLGAGVGGLAALKRLRALERLRARKREVLDRKSPEARVPEQISTPSKKTASFAPMSGEVSKRMRVALPSSALIS